MRSISSFSTPPRAAMAAEEKQAAGLSPEDAWREARLELGGMEVVKERVYDASIGASLETIWRDVRYALRNVRSRPGFAVAVVLTIALAVGANAAISCVVRSGSVPVRPRPAFDVTNPEAFAPGSTANA